MGDKEENLKQSSSSTSTLKKRETTTKKEVIEEKKEKKEKVETKEEREKEKVKTIQVQPKNAFCIRFFGIILITIITFSVWSVFNGNEVNPDSSFYIKEMPAPLLRHYQSGQTIPVFDKSTGDTFNVFISQNGLDWDRVIPDEEELEKQKKFGVLSTIVIDENFNDDIEEQSIVKTNSVDNEVAILIHGQTTTSFAYRKTLSYIQKERVHPIAIDLPCFGFSDSLKNCTYREIADRLDDILDSLQIRKSVHLVLYDTGAVIGTLFAMDHPNRVKSITYIDPHIDLTNTPLYYRLMKTPFFNRLYLKFFTSPYIASIRYKFLNDRFQLRSKFITQSDIDSYFYIFRYKNNMNNFINTITTMDPTFSTTYNLITSSYAMNRETPVYVILTSRYISSYQSTFFQQRFNGAIRHTDTTQTHSIFFEDNPSSVAFQLVHTIDEIDKNLRLEKPKPKQQQQQSSGNAHGHSHGSGNAHGHSHGGGNAHGHSHGGNAHGHSHGSGNAHGHSHGSGNAHGHSHGGGDQYGLGHNYGM